MTPSSLSRKKKKESNSTKLEKSIDSLQELAKKVTVCDRCELARLGSKPVPGEGSTNARIIFVGEAPNTQSERDGRPFVGWTGRALEQWLDYLGIPRHEVYVTNAVKCVLRESSGKADRSGYGPLSHWLLACHRWLDQELSLVEAKVIITVGAAALNSLLNVSVSTFQAEGYSKKVKDRFYCALYHPGRHTAVLTDDEKKVLDEVRRLMQSEL